MTLLASPLHIIFAATCTIVLCQEYEVVQTAVGKIRGLVETVGKEKVFNFRGIPFAKPPIGDLRFRKPQPYGPWDYTLDATKDASPCMQTLNFGGLKFVTNDEISENCLVLNIHVPGKISNSQNKAVMVWIHGGGFFIGQGSWYNASELALKGDVIVVTVNYRLGIFGFLSTFDEASPGNYGLWDQILALQWVKSNIAAFGGNPSLMTIFGESAGGISVSLQTLIPYNKGLFQRAIAQSGVANTAKLATKSRAVYDFFAQQGDCNDISQENTHTWVQCLRQLPAAKLLNVSMEVMKHHMTKMDFNMILGPALDGDLFKADPRDLFSDTSSEEQKFFRSLDYMAGTTDGEGSLLLMMLPMLAEKYQMNITEGVPTSVICEVYTPKFANVYYNGARGAADALCSKCKVDNSKENYLAQQGENLMNLYGDLLFVGPTIKTLKEHEKKNPKAKTYHYVFTADRDFSEMGIHRPPWYQRSGHGTELLYLFGSNGLTGVYNLTDSELKLTDVMIKYWSNFAKYGDPNGQSLPQWKEYGSEKNYLDLNHQISSGKDLFSDRISFLQDDMHKLMETTEKHEEL